MSARQRLLDAAREHFYTGGITATGINELVEAADVARMSLYNNFASKDDLVTAYLRDRHQRWEQRLERRIEAAPGPTERLLAPFDEYLAYATGEAGFRGCAFVNGAAELDDDHPGRAVIRDHKAAIAARLEELAREAGAADPERLAGELFLLLEGGFVTAGIRREPGPLERARALAAAAVRRDQQAA